MFQRLFGSARREAPLAVAAAGFPLPPLYHTLCELDWRRLDPWVLLRGEAFLEAHRSLNAGLARLHERTAAHHAARVVVPLARCTATGHLACLEAIPASDRVLLIRPGDEPEVLERLASFADWLRGAVEDVIRLADGQQPALPGRGAERQDALDLDPAPLPFERPEDRAGEDPRSSTRRHLLRKLRESEVDLGFVAAQAGDGEPSSPELRRRRQRIKRLRGDRIFSDMLFVLTQQRYPDRMAKWLWGRILRHKEALSQDLRRPVEVTVASLDFLNQHQHLVEGSLVLCSEDELTQVAEVALRDGLTGLFDQATFRERLRRELERARRYETPTAVLLLDLDHFKRVNDEYGHPAGDRVLSELGALLNAELRAVDVAARYGGEEFAAFLPETRASEAKRLADRLRQLVKARFAGDPGPRVSISVGVAGFPGDGRDVRTLIGEADRALYRSKQSGRNRTTCAADLPTASPSAPQNAG